MLANLDERFQAAVQSFWNVRAAQKDKQVASGKTLDTGNRSAATGGAHMSALEVLLTDVLLDAGIVNHHIRARTSLELPGYYRSEKKWDLLVVVDNHLLLAVEFKAHIGPSFGNNVNNRVEEALGNSEDIWTAFREGRFGQQPPPLVGYFMLLEDCPRVHAPVRNTEPFFKVDPIFKAASYAKRYEVLCNRLVLERKYSAACLTLATNADPSVVTFPSPALSFRQFAAQAHAHAQAFLNAQPPTELPDHQAPLTRTESGEKGR